MSAPLAGVLVADFSRVLAGPLATMALADLGATVVKVERPGVGDDTRAWGPPWTAQGVATYFESVNRTKASLALDLADPDDLPLAHELAARADVFVENFRPGALGRFGLDYAAVAARNPRIVYASVSGFGAGAGADLPGYDFVVQAVGGLMSMTGQPGGDPTKVGVALVDVLTGKDATIGILAALNERQRSGLGCHVEVNLLSSLLGSLVNQASGYLGAGSVPAPMGNQHPSIAPYETLACSDGLLAVACGNDGQFRRLAAVLGAPELADDPAFATNAARVGNRGRLVVELETLLSAGSVREWQERLTAAGVPAGGVNTVPAAFDLAEQLGLDPTLDLGPDASPQVRPAVTYSRPLLSAPTPPPRLGQHSSALRAWLAGPAEAPPPGPDPATPVLVPTHGKTD